MKNPPRMSKGIIIAGPIDKATAVFGVIAEMK